MKNNLGLLAFGTLFSCLHVNALEQPASANDFIKTFETLDGQHNGVRKAHAKGVCLSGKFTPDRKKAYSAYTDSPLFIQDSDLVLRFSMGGGNPHASDAMGGPRGMAVKFMMPDGSSHMLAGLSVPLFPGATPDDFLGLLKTFEAKADGTKDIERIKAYRAAHPSLKARQQWQETHASPYSYQNSDYYGIHTFFFTKQDKEQKFRWTLVPQDGFKAIDGGHEATPDFYLKRLKDRLETGNVNFKWVATIGQDGDTNTNPSVLWPENRENITLGQVSITGFSNACDGFTFDPNIMADGFKASDDPVLKMRSPAYGISFGKRLSNQ